jgi:glycosyltransferase involved in cell wall biosynthesis
MKPLFDMLSEQVEELDDPNDVELLVFLDNKRRSIGYKRDALVQIARGDYLAFADDDDVVSPYYIKHAMKAIKEAPDVDVITFKERVIINKSAPMSLTFELGYPQNEAVQQGKEAKRPPWHCCFWKRELVQQFRFPDSMYGEDWAWAVQCNQVAKTSHHIDKYMRAYIYDDDVTEAIG